MCQHSFEDLIASGLASENIGQSISLLQKVCPRFQSTGLLCSGQNKVVVQTQEISKQELTGKPEMPEELPRMVGTAGVHWLS